MPKNPQTVPASKDVLKWARETRGLTVSEAALSLGIPDQALADIEAGKQLPTSAIFDKMITVYKQTESILLLERHPSIAPLPNDYRTVGGRRPKLSPDTRLAIRTAQELQSYLSELVEDDPELIDRVKLPTASVNDDPEKTAATVRALLGVPLGVQLTWKPGNESFNNWREHLQKKGLLILLKKMPWKDCRGFSLWDGSLLPAIVVNSEDVPAARIFTLFHECAHLILRNTGICTLSAINAIEQWCNRFSGAFLLPATNFTEHIKTYPMAGPNYDWPMGQLARLASYYRVSRSVMALRLQHLGLAVSTYYDRHKGELNNFDQTPKPSKPPKIIRKPGWKEKQTLREVGSATASVIVAAWKEHIADATEAADILNLSLDELHGLQAQTEVRVRNVG
jgi:Zn-dependent peptidase ImmA (M78 family)/DNA-binding XRE family transcriptional regulator